MIGESHENSLHFSGILLIGVGQSESKQRGLNGTSQWSGRANSAGGLDVHAWPRRVRGENLWVHHSSPNTWNGTVTACDYTPQRERDLEVLK